MSRWWRAYDEAVDDPKLLLLSDRAHRAWFNLMCLASIGEGRLPERKVIELKLRLPPAKAQAVLKELIDAGLIDEDETGLKPHNWNGRQYKSDVSTERVKRFRNGNRNVSVTPPETESRKQKEEKDDAPDGAPPKYLFESGVIRLSERDFRKWEQSFSNLDLRAELIGLTQWAGHQKDWFFAVSGALAKRNREVGIAIKSRPERRLDRVIL